MAFLSGLMGGGKADSIVDQAVDKVADVAKEKVKEIMGGDKKTAKETEEGGASGGINALAGMLSSDDSKEKEKEKESGGGFSDLFSGGKDEKKPKSGDGELSLTDTLGNIAKEVSGGDKPKEDKPKEDDTANQVLSFGKSLFS